MNGWGGRREGSGRPIGWRKEISDKRPTHTVRAYDDEWDLIKQFAEVVKHGDKEKAKRFFNEE